MKTHSKSNNFIAILIALLLFAIGFILYFLHQQAQTENDPGNTQTAIERGIISQQTSSESLPAGFISHC